jgi:recombinational DNA repair protein (RecF pathway)
VDSKPNGEAGRLLSIFTRELGLIMASAQGVRLSVSKLRYHTQDFSYGTFSFVKGKEIWRLTGASESEIEVNELYIRSLALLRRLLHGEEKNEILFDELVASTGFFKKSLNSLTKEKASVAECLMVIRILHHLGYVGNIPELNEFLSGSVEEIWNDGTLVKMEKQKNLAIKHINSGLKASQL